MSAINDHYVWWVKCCEPLLMMLCKRRNKDAVDWCQRVSAQADDLALNYSLRCLICDQPILDTCDTHGMEHLKATGLVAFL